MPIPFTDIYTKAVGLFDDPQITAAYQSNEIQFCKLMYTYLQNSVSSFANPAYIGFLLAEQTAPSGQMQVWESDGTTTSFVLDESFTLIDGSLYNYIECCDYVSGTLDVANRTVTFPDKIEAGSKYSFEQYFPGQFANSFSSVAATSTATVYALTQMKDILARLLVLSWAEEQRNFLLDITNLMTDTDFKLSPNSKILTAKDQWTDQLLSEVSMMQNRLAWQIRFAKNAGWGLV
jgi:hypothetical protein